MTCLPFYIPTEKKLKIVIAGGGYAGITALVTFLRHLPDASITIIDPRSQHIKITHLHETFRYPLQDILLPFSTLEKRFHCRHICAELALEESTLLQWQNDKFMTIQDEIIEFDYLLVATGANSNQGNQTKKTKNTLDLNDFLDTAGSDLLNNYLTKNNKDEHCISVVGGGATSIQFLFEISYFLRRQKIKSKLRLINGEDRVLKQFPESLSRYVETRMDEMDIDFYPNTYYKEQRANTILLEEKGLKKEFSLPSALSLLFLGKQSKNLLSANTFGQVIVNQQALQSIFTAGDCSVYHAYGSNTMTAQSAVRKGKLAAHNILRNSGILKLLEPYLHCDLGYVVSLGPTDAVGWLGLEGNSIGGTAALLIKEMVESQYDLLLAGIDTYRL